MDSRKIDIRYLAGLIDGEGNIGVYKRSRKTYVTYQGILRIGMCDPVIIKYLHKVFGGEYHIYGTKKKHHRPCHYWCTTNSRLLVSLLTRLLPFLIVKKAQALLVIRFVRRMQYWQNKGGYFNCPVTKNERRIRDCFYKKTLVLNAKGL